MITAILALNGPNLHVPSDREAQISDHETLANVEAPRQAKAPGCTCQANAKQTNLEHKTVERAHTARHGAAGMVSGPRVHGAPMVVPHAMWHPDGEARA